jgi:hypothetical protein
VLDEKGEKLAKWDVNKIWDEELFFLLYEKFFP